MATANSKPYQQNVIYYFINQLLEQKEDKVNYCARVKVAA